MPGSPDTILTYDRIAPAYLDHRRDRSAMLKAFEDFSNLLAPGGLVFDVGCGPGFDAVELRARGLRVIGFDLSAGMIGLGAREYPGSFVRADMRRFPALNAADGLWVNASLLHVKRKEVLATLEGFWQVLKPGGILLVTLKNGRGEGWEPTRYDRTVSRWFTYWSEASVRDALWRAEFEIQRLDAGESWIYSIARRPQEKA